jgi:hypothetical protein
MEMLQRPIGVMKNWRQITPAGIFFRFQDFVNLIFGIDRIVIIIDEDSFLFTDSFNLLLRRLFVKCFMKSDLYTLMVT